MEPKGEPAHTHNQDAGAGGGALLRPGSGRWFDRPDQAAVAAVGGSFAFGDGAAAAGRVGVWACTWGDARLLLGLWHPLLKLVGQARPRFRRAGDHVVTYPAPESAAAQDLLAAEIMSGLLRCGHPLPAAGGQGRVGVTVRACVTGADGVRTPDLDNVVKLVLDAASGLVYRDDRQVRRIGSEMVFGWPACGLGLGFWLLDSGQSVFSGL